MDDDSESCFFIGSQTFAVPNYGNRTGVCQIRLAVGGQNLLALIIQNFSEKPNTFSYACSELRMEYLPFVGAALRRDGVRSSPDNLC